MMSFDVVQQCQLSRLGVDTTQTGEMQPHTLFPSAVFVFGLCFAFELQQCTNTHKHSHVYTQRERDTQTGG